MINFFTIKNQNLRNLIKKSKRFQALSEKEQNQYINRIKNLPQKQQAKIMEFFIDENKKEKTLNKAPVKDEKQAELLIKFLKELENLKQKYTKLARQDRENVENGKEEKEKEELLKKLDAV